MANLDLLWANCVELVKDRINSRSFWEAVEAVSPVVLENDVLVIGLDPSEFNRATHIQQSAHMAAITQVVEEMFNRKTQVRLIEGTTVAEWEAVKVREQRVAAMKQATVARQTVQHVVSDSWEALYDQIARLAQRSPNRALPQGKARFANEALYVLVEAMEELYQDDADEMTERSLARALDRIAGASEIPAAVLGFELERLRAWRRADVESQPEE
jgi:hypothetical protein